MIIASTSGHVAVAQLLIEWGADIEAKGEVRPFKTILSLYTVHKICQHLERCELISLTSSLNGKTPWHLILCTVPNCGSVGPQRSSMLR